MPRNATIRKIYSPLVVCFREADTNILRYQAAVVNDKTHTFTRVYHTSFSTFDQAYAEANQILAVEYYNQ